MSHAPLAAGLFSIFTILIAGCGSGGGGGSSAPAQPAYINGTSTGQYGSNDLGFFLGARTSPTTLTAATVGPKLEFDIGNGFTTTASNIHWIVTRNGVAFASGNVTIEQFGFATIDVPIPAGAGSAAYHIVIDDVNAFSEANENNNFVDFTIAIPASG